MIIKFSDIEIFVCILDTWRIFRSPCDSKTLTVKNCCSKEGHCWNKKLTFLSRIRHVCRVSSRLPRRRWAHRPREERITWLTRARRVPSWWATGNDAEANAERFRCTDTREDIRRIDEKANVSTLERSWVRATMNCKSVLIYPARIVFP